MVEGDSPATIFFWVSVTAALTASLPTFRSATSELSAVVVVFTSAVLLAAAEAVAVAVTALASAAAAADLASLIWASRLASSSCNCLSCSCCASRVFRSASTCSARRAVADFTGGFAGFFVFAAGACCGSASFGVSANATPDIRKNDNTIAAIFLISSLIGRNATILPCVIANAKLKIPVRQRMFPQVKLEPASYSHVNQL